MFSRHEYVPMSEQDLHIMTTLVDISIEREISHGLTLTQSYRSSVAAKTGRIHFFQRQTSVWVAQSQVISLDPDVFKSKAEWMYLYSLGMLYIYYLYAYMYICMIKKEIMNLGGDTGNMGKHRNHRCYARIWNLKTNLQNHLIMLFHM